MTSITIKQFLIAVLVLVQGSLAFADSPESTQQISSRTVVFSVCSKDPLSQDESIRLIYDRTKLVLIHENAWFNCATHGSDLVIQQDASSVTRLSEHEIRGNVYDFCLCYYTAIYELSNIKSGHYEFEIRNRTEGTPASISFEIKEGVPSSALIKIRPVPPKLSILSKSPN